MVSDVLVLGGGLAGASAALQLARMGVPVQLFERETGPHDKICGEFLSIGAQHELDQLGIDIRALGAVPVNRVRLKSGQKQIEAKLPFVAQGICRRKLDEALLEAAARAGAEIHRGIRINAVDGREVRTSAGPASAARILLATGKRDVRGVPRSAETRSREYVGFKMHWRVRADQRDDLAHVIEMAFFDGGYVGMQLVSADVMNMCLIVRSDYLARAGGTWDGLIGKLGEERDIVMRIANADPIFQRPLSIANLPYGFVHAPANDACAPSFRLGDQFALTAPLTGDGMSIALRSAKMAVKCIEAGVGVQEFHASLRDAVKPQVRHAMFLQAFAGSALARQFAAGIFGLLPFLLTKLAAMTRLAEIDRP